MNRRSAFKVFDYCGTIGSYAIILFAGIYVNVLKLSDQEILLNYF